MPPENQWSDATNVNPFGTEATRVDSPIANQPTQGMPAWIEDTLVRPPTQGSFPKAQPIPMQTQSLFAPFNAPAPLPRTVGTATFPAAKPVTGAFAALPRPARKITGTFPSVPRPPEGPLMASISDAILKPVPSPPGTATVVARPPKEDSSATATALEPIDDPPTGPSLKAMADPGEPTVAAGPALTGETGPSLEAVVEAGDSTAASTHIPVEKKPARRTQATAPKTSDPNEKLKLILLVAVPLAVLLLGLVIWLAVRAPTPPTVIELPNVAEPVIAKPPPPPPVAQPTPEPVPTPAPVEAPKLLAGKPVVLDYPDKPSPAVPGTNDAVIAKARALADKGAARLAAKDGKGAVKFFRASMKTYPAYLAAYRGLGRALAATNDKKGALQMLNIYLRAVPEADDAEELKALVAKLSAPAPAKKKGPTRKK